MLRGNREIVGKPKAFFGLSAHGETCRLSVKKESLLHKPLKTGLLKTGRWGDLILSRFTTGGVCLSAANPPEVMLLLKGFIPSASGLQWSQSIA